MRKLIVLLLGAAMLMMAFSACGGGGHPRPIIPTPPPNSHDVSGTLTDPYGNPIANASLLINGVDSGITTDSSGNYTIPRSMVSEGRTMRIGVRQQGVMMGEREFMPGAPWRFDWQLGELDPNGGIINGLVFDAETESTIYGAVLVLFSEDWVAAITNESDGTYEFAGVPEGNYHIIAFAAGYRLQMKSLSVESGNTTQLAIGLERTAGPNPSEGFTVKGRIVDAVSGGGVPNALVQGSSDNGWYYICDTTYTGIKEPPLTQDGSSGGGNSGSGETEPSILPMPPFDDSGYRYWEVPVYQETYTDENGYYEFPDPFNGMGVYISSSQTDYMPASSYFTRESDGEVAANLEMQPIIPVLVNGRVTNGSGVPVYDAYVEFIYIDPNFFGRGYAVPGAGGLENMDAAGIAWAKAGQTDAALPGAAPPPSGGGFDQSLDSYGMASYRNEMRNRKSSSMEVVEPFGYYAAETDENGDYDLGEIPAGYYSVFVSCYGYLSHGSEVEVTEGTGAMDFTIVEVPVGTVTGKVTDDTGKPIDKALVNATQPNVDPFTFTDENGNFVLSNVPAGTWRVGAYKEGYSARAVTIEIVEDVVIDLSFTLPVNNTPPPTNLVTLTGKVIDGSTNAALANADIVAVAEDDSFYSYVKSSSSGNYVLQLPAGVYNVLVQVPGYQDVYIQVWVDPEWPTFDFYMWPHNYRGDWGVIVNGTAPPPSMPPSKGR